MNEQRPDGAARVRQLGRARVHRSVTIKRDLDQRIVDRMKREDVPYSRVVEEAVEALLAAEAV